MLQHMFTSAEARFVLQLACLRRGRYLSRHHWRRLCRDPKTGCEGDEYKLRKSINLPYLFVFPSEQDTEANLRFGRMVVGYRARRVLCVWRLHVL